MENKKPVLISDLIALIHYVIIRELSENTVILSELQAIDQKIASGELKDLDVSSHPIFQAIIRDYLK